MKARTYEFKTANGVYETTVNLRRATAVSLNTTTGVVSVWFGEDDEWQVYQGKLAEARKVYWSIKEQMED